jgi:hypothetical protein
VFSTSDIAPSHPCRGLDPRDLAVDPDLEVVSGQAGDRRTPIVENASVNDNARNVDTLDISRRLLSANHDVGDQCGDRRGSADRRTTSARGVWRATHDHTLSLLDASRASSPA